MQKLTETQQATLDFVRAYIRENGMAPTMLEIASGMGWRSPNNAHEKILALQKKGYLTMKPGTNRGLVLTRSGYDHDSAALNAATRIMAIIETASREKTYWPDVRLKAAIQVEVISAMQRTGCAGE